MTHPFAAKCDVVIANLTRIRDALLLAKEHTDEKPFSMEAWIAQYQALHPTRPWSGPAWFNLPFGSGTPQIEVTPGEGAAGNRQQGGGINGAGRDIRNPPKRPGAGVQCGGALWKLQNAQWLNGRAVLKAQEEARKNKRPYVAPQMPVSRDAFEALARAYSDCMSNQKGYGNGDGFSGHGGQFGGGGASGHF